MAASSAASSEAVPGLVPRLERCDWNTVSAVAIALHPGANTSRRFLGGYARVLGTQRLSILSAVDGNNHSQTLAWLLDSGLAFHDLSKGGRRWGMLGNVLSHYYALEHQVEHKLPYQLTLEEDLFLRPHFREYINRVCDVAYNNNTHLVKGVRRPRRSPVLVQLSRYSELLLTPLWGAHLLIKLFQRAGIRKSIDQQLLDGKVMGHKQHIASLYYLNVRNTSWGDRAWALGRAANSAEGNIWKTRRFTWTELAMLRMVTQGVVKVRALENLGNPRLAADARLTTWAH
jgi:GR25 family glycosyltransferase involved in LPS biosynthesis